MIGGSACRYNDSIICENNNVSFSNIIYNPSENLKSPHFKAGGLLGSSAGRNTNSIILKNNNVSLSSFNFNNILFSSTTNDYSIITDDYTITRHILEFGGLLGKDAGKEASTIEISYDKPVVKPFIPKEALQFSPRSYGNIAPNTDFSPNTTISIKGVYVDSSPEEYYFSPGSYNKPIDGLPIDQLINVSQRMKDNFMSRTNIRELYARKLLHSRVSSTGILHEKKLLSNTDNSSQIRYSNLKLLHLPKKTTIIANRRARKLFKLMNS